MTAAPASASRSERRWYSGRQPLHMGVDARPEPGLAQPPLFVDEEAVAVAPGRHHEAGHRITIAELWPSDQPR